MKSVICLFLTFFASMMMATKAESTAPSSLSTKGMFDDKGSMEEMAQHLEASLKKILKVVQKIEENAEAFLQETDADILIEDQDELVKKDDIPVDDQNELVKEEL